MNVQIKLHSKISPNISTGVLKYLYLGHINFVLINIYKKKYSF